MPPEAIAPSCSSRALHLGLAGAESFFEGIFRHIFVIVSFVDNFWGAAIRSIFLFSRKILP